MKICENFACRKEFEPIQKHQRYCCKKCTAHDNYRRRVESGKEQEYGKQYRAAHPDKKYKKTAAAYRKGRLPEWMFS